MTLEAGPDRRDFSSSAHPEDGAELPEIGEHPSCDRIASTTGARSGGGAAFRPGSANLIDADLSAGQQMPESGRFDESDAVRIGE
jgi:hypothetical protein